MALTRRILGAEVRVALALAVVSADLFRRRGIEHNATHQNTATSPKHFFKA